MEYSLISGGVTAAEGFTASGIHCGIRKNKSKKDLALIYSDTLCNAAAVYTTNLVKSAPIRICQKHLADGKAQAVIVNSGNANTCNADGDQKALRMCELVATQTGVRAQDVLVGSTGVIGSPFPSNRSNRRLLRWRGPCPVKGAPTRRKRSSPQIPVKRKWRFLSTWMAKR